MRRINFILHCMICAVLFIAFRFILQCSDDSYNLDHVALIATLLFAIHPVNTEVLCSAVGRADLFCALLFIIGIVHYADVMESYKEKNIDGDGWIPFVKYVCVFHISLLCMLSKEIGLMLIPFCIAMEMMVNFHLPEPRRFEKACRFRTFWNACYDSVLRIIGLALFLAALVWFRLHALNYEMPHFTAQENYVAGEKDMFTRWMTYPYVHAMHFWLLICPEWLCCDWSSNSISLVKSIFNYCFIPGLILYKGLIMSFQHSTNVRIGAALIVIPFIPCSNLFPIGFVIAERVLYIPAMGFCLLVSIGFNVLLQRYKKHSNRLYTILGVVAFWWIVRANMRVADWRSEISLYSSGVAVNPRNAKLQYNLGTEYQQIGYHKIAQYYLRNAHILNPNHTGAINNLASSYRRLNLMNESIEFCQKALDLDPEDGLAWMNIALAYALLNQHNDSLAAYQKASQIKPYNERITYNMGVLYVEMENFDRAREMFRKTLELNPKYYQAHINYVVLMADHGTLEQLQDACAAAEYHGYDSPAVLLAVADAMSKKNMNFQHMKSLYLRVLKLNPFWNVARIRLALACAKREDYLTAVFHYKVVSKSNPDLVINDPDYIQIMNLMKIQGVNVDEVKDPDYPDDDLEIDPDELFLES